MHRTIIGNNHENHANYECAVIFYHWAVYYRYDMRI